MKKGDRVSCPVCGESTIVKVLPVMDGWTRKRNGFFCALCGAKLGDAAQDSAPANAASHEERDKLAALLDLTEKDTAKPQLEHEKNHFCRDCRHFVIHPFFSHCTLDAEKTDPMGDCVNFIRK